MKVKLQRTIEIKKKISSKKKVKGFSSLSDFLEKQFEPPNSSLSIPGPVPSSNQSEQISDIAHSENTSRSDDTTESVLSNNSNESEHVRNENSQSCSDDTTGSVLSSNCNESEHVRNENSQSCNDDTTGSVLSSNCEIEMSKSREENCSVYKSSQSDEAKQSNLVEYELSKRKKALAAVERQMSNVTEKLQGLKMKLGHYSVKNVNKRDDISRKNVLVLRETQRTVRKQGVTIQKLTDSNNTYLEKIRNLETENNELKDLVKDKEGTTEALRTEEKKKVIAQKNASHYKASWKRAKEQLRTAVHQEDNGINAELLDMTREIEGLTFELERMQDLLQNQVQTRNKDGSFADSIRTCIIELTGLEVANEKVSPVISTVAKHLFEKEFNKGDLPSSKTVQTIVDEGHYVAKAFISEKLSHTDSWGLNRDGTTRKKHKLLDTSITLSSGEVMSLGFTRVSRETAVEINNTTKEHLNELANIQVNLHEEGNAQDYIRESFEKMAFTMSDRAATEKKANEDLSNWRDDLLHQCDRDNDRNEVLHFYCMAHVLLGFHSYTSKEMREHENHLVSEVGPLGRDNIALFKYWSKQGTIVERVVRTVSEVFGPSGDHRGVRDLWEAYCSTHGIKSLIGNYRDNRFNAIFQNAAEIIVHRKDFIAVLETVPTPNLKLKAVLADLKSDVIAVLLQCYGLFYIKVTGPYWNLVTSSGVPYLYLYRHITELHGFLNYCIDNPASLLINVNHWSEEDPADIARIPNRGRLSEYAFQIPEDHREQLFAAIKCVAKGMLATVNKQLVDFLPGGKYCGPPTEDELTRTSFAHVTNLACEHHFGDLDSSQRRRPSASMHHHSSVQLIKRNRVKMMNWLDNMPTERRQELLKTARKGGKALREVHLRKEKSVLTEIHREMQSAKNKKRKNRDNHNDRQRNRQRPDVPINEENESPSLLASACLGTFGSIFSFITRPRE